METDEFARKINSLDKQVVKKAKLATSYTLRDVTPQWRVVREKLNVPNASMKRK